ncbi:hypothetical protein D3C86_830780 [compost metagenome]
MNRLIIFITNFYVNNRKVIFAWNCKFFLSFLVYISIASIPFDDNLAVFSPSLNLVDDKRKFCCRFDRFIKFYRKFFSVLLC